MHAGNDMELANCFHCGRNMLFPSACRFVL